MLPVEEVEYDSEGYDSLSGLDLSKHEKFIITHALSFASDMDKLGDSDEDPGEEKAEEKSLERERSEFILSPGGSLRRLPTGRRDHLQQQLLKKRASVYFVGKMLNEADAEESTLSMKDALTSTEQKKLEEDTAFLRHADGIVNEIRRHFPLKDNSVEVRIENFSYLVKVNPATHKIKTVYNQSILYDISKWFQRVRKGEKKPTMKTHPILEDINLSLKPGKMYLVLGPPGSGKSTLLKAVAGRLGTSGGETIEGSIQYNGISLEEKSDFFMENAISFVSQLDYHAPRLTVKETFDFSFQCKSGGTHAPKESIKTEAARDLVKKLDAEGARTQMNLEGLGLSHVADTFVGNDEVRGVSGGQRRRVTLGEMFHSGTPILCGDEISNGLDAASTYDIMFSMMHYTRLSKMTRVISLLQPSPETVSLFDEVILLAEGRLLYAGEVSSVENYFASLGYKAPNQMDVADFLQLLSTADGADLFSPPEGSTRTKAYTMQELSDIFMKSHEGHKLRSGMSARWNLKWESKLKKDGSSNSVPLMASLRKKYANSYHRSAWLNVRRNIIIWLRDKRFLIANGIKNIIMGVSVGAVFWQTDNIASLYGVVFQLMLFIMLGAMVAVPEQVSDRRIYYKMADANFFGAFAYVSGQAIALIPQTLIDVSIFGTLIYWMVGFTAQATNFFIFIAVIFVFALVMNQMLSIFAAFASTKSAVQGFSACVLLFLIVFCGFIVIPTVIPDYYIWIYWWNPLAWAYRALLVNEFTSSDWEDIVPGTNFTTGYLALISGGQELDGEPFGKKWIGYSFVYLVPYSFLCTFITGICLKFVRVSDTGNVSSGVSADELHEQNESDGEEDIALEFTPVTLTFNDVCYDVTTSKGKEQLRLLHDVTGVFKSGRMCALMGSSGAGKTTLMDVIALRKTSGTVTGDIRLNGFEQEKKSFRRCSGYVEQFDVQASQLTVRETVLFSARLRLDSRDPNFADDDAKQRFVDQVLHTLELGPLADCSVGVDGQGGLSFEQRKRLSIAVELAAKPSIIFLDEPTSGLDARAALLVVKALRLIVNKGCNVICTIHQPSSAVFEMFDDLLLLKKGGHTVFFGELGEQSCNLVKYLEARGATPIDLGENPANWMLTAITSEQSTVDFAEEYRISPEFERAKEMVQTSADTRDPEKEIKFEKQFGVPRSTRSALYIKRLQTIYWRSPTYNLTRMLISLIIAFLLGSVFITMRNSKKYTEQEMTSILGTIFISFIIIGVLSITSVLPVMLEIRDNFYRHRNAGMVSHFNLAVALGRAEMWFIVLSSALFCVVFLATIGIHTKVYRDIAFWGFFTFNLALYSYFGQAFMCLVRGMSTAQILASVWIGLNNFFSGFIVRPQYLSGIFQVTYWITPGHYVYEGLVMTQFNEDQTPVEASPGSAFYFFLIDSGDCNPEADAVCTGTVEEFLDQFFGGKFSRDHVWYDAVVLGAYLVVARLATLWALKKFNYTSS